MGATINIDTGGTFTDGYFTRGSLAGRVKVDTTPHDLTECLADCVAGGAEELGYPSVKAMLLDTDVFRFSSTIGTNSIIQRSGPRIGLLTSSGVAKRLEQEHLAPFLRPEMIREIDDPFDDESVRRTVRDLLVSGARILVISLVGSENDPGGEQAVRAAVQRDYPRHYLGAVPCLLASEITPRPGIERRTATAVLDAYLHQDMVRVLYKADEDLRREGLRHPLLIVHSSGALARVAKTRAIETYNSGPVAGLHGSARLAAHYGLEHVVAMDIGGTSTDISLIVGGVLPFETGPQVGGVPVLAPMIRVDAIGGGGGSVARAGDGGYTVGPDSMGAVPGPACYALGGTHATVTDAEVVLGHIDPDWFLGGRRRLDPARALAAIERIAGGAPAAEAASDVHGALVEIVAAKITELVRGSGAPASEFSLFAFGGAGGLFAADVARACGIRRSFTFPQSSVFSAFGASGMDVNHVYELRAGEDFDEALAALRDRAVLDLEGEGFDTSTLAFQLEIDGEQGVQVVPLDDGWKKAAGWISSDTRGARLRAISPVTHAPLAPSGVSAGAVEPKSRRVVRRRDGERTVPVYDRDLLPAGATVAGLAIVESADTTILVPEWARLVVDEFGNGIIEP